MRKIGIFFFYSKKAGTTESENAREGKKKKKSVRMAFVNSEQESDKGNE